MKLFLNLSLFICLSAICITFSSCKEDTTDKTEYIVVNDTLSIPIETDGTTFIIVRHAEKSTVGNDPDLTEEGNKRAEKLAVILTKIKLDKVYSTDYNRTNQTAMPTAKDQGLTTTNYEALEHDVVIDAVLENQNIGKVLIVGHSNTLHNFLNTLTATSDYSELPESSYDNLYIVNSKSKGDSKVIVVKF